MTITVSISQFRKNIADYLAKAKNGYTIILKDEKKEQEIGKLVGKKSFDPEGFEKALNAAAGVFSAQNHPEWRTKKAIISWVNKSRLDADRKF